MSLYRPKRSPFWHYDFRLDGYRFSGSTKQRNEDDAARAEETAKADAQRIVDRIRAAGAEPLTLKAACDRWHSTHGARLADGKNKAVLDRLVAIIGARTYLHDINDDVVARMVEERAKDVRRDSTDDKGRQLYRPITPTTVNRTLDALRRVVRRARDNWNAALPHHLLRPRLAQARDLEGRRRRRATARFAPHHGHAHAAENRQPARGAKDPRPYRYCDHGEILHRRDARGHARSNGRDRAAPGRAEQTKSDRTERRLG
jgi:hypothetical protein